MWKIITTALIPTVLLVTASGDYKTVSKYGLYLKNFPVFGLLNLFARI